MLGRHRQRAILAVVAAAAQLGGFVVLLPLLPASTFWSFLPVAAGFCLSAWTGLALAERVAGIPGRLRKLPIAVLTTAGLLGINYYLVAYTHARNPLALLGGACVAFNLVVPSLAGASRRGGGVDSPPVFRAWPGGTRWAKPVAWLVVGAVTGFVLWHEVVESLRPPYYEEAMVIGELRQLISAEQAYSEAGNAGSFDTLDCLQAPSRCLPDYPPSAPVFLPADFPSPGVRHYRRRFVAGPRVAPEDRPARTSASSLGSFAYVAVPSEPHGLEGLLWRIAGFSLRGARGFCADSTGRICATENGIEPKVVDGLCAPDCTLMR